MLFQAKKIRRVLMVAFVILTLGIGWFYYRKYKESGKLKVGDVSLVPEKKIKTIDDLLYIFKNGLKLLGTVTIRNFSGKDFTLNQMSLDTYSPVEEKLITTQTNIMQNDIKLAKKNTTNIPIAYDVDITNSLKLFKESEVIPEEFTVWKIITNPLKAYKAINLNNLKVKLKGFIQAEGITIPIDEIINLYE